MAVLTTLYVVTAPLVLIKDTAGVTHYVYEGALLDWVSAETAEDLVDAGMLEEVDAELVAIGEHVVDPEPVGATTDLGNGADNDVPLIDLTKLKGTRPPAAAGKEAWVDYAELNGVPRADAEKLNKVDIQSLFTAPE